MQICLDNNSHEPAFVQIAKQIRRLIQSGGLKPGDELPSVRSIASEIAVNPMTVSKAFQRLADDGLIARRRGKAMTVAAQPQRLSAVEGVIEAAFRVLLTPVLDEAFDLNISASTITEIFFKLVTERQIAAQSTDGTSTGTKGSDHR